MLKDLLSIDLGDRNIISIGGFKVWTAGNIDELYLELEFFLKLL